MVKDEDSKEDGEEAVTDSKEKTSKKRTIRKAKRDAAWTRALLVTTVHKSSTPASASIPVPGLSAAVPRSSAPASMSIRVPGSSAAVLESSVAVPGSSVSVPESFAAVPRSSAPASVSVPVPGLFAHVPLSTPMLPDHPPCLFLHCLRRRPQHLIWP